MKERKKKNEAKEKKENNNNNTQFHTIEKWIPWSVKIYYVQI